MKQQKLTSLDRLKSKQRTGATIQEFINSQPVTNTSVTTMRLLAGAQHQEYRQYENKWNNHHVVVIQCEVKTKLGLAFKKGDITLGRLERDPLDFEVRYSVHSFRNGCDTIIDEYSAEDYFL